MQKLTYTLLFVVSVFAIYWVLQPDHQDSQDGSINASGKPWTVSNTSVSPLKIDNKQNYVNSEPSDVSVSDDLYCSDLCRESMKVLRFPAVLTDDEYEELLGRIGELAAYLRKNSAVRAEFLELADTEDGDKRSVIMAVFNQLDINARWSLGEVLIESSDWHSRFDGISFLAQPDIMDEQLAQRFSDMLAVDSDHYVRSSIIKALNQPDKFYGNQEILNALEQVGYSDQNNTVRGEALLARVQLEQAPETVFYDVFSAIRSNEAGYQGYGLRALEKIVTRQTLDGLEISWEYQDEAKYLFDELMSPEYGDMPADLRKMADDLLERFF